MTRKIFLEGELGSRFGTVFSFSGPTVADALRCIGANRPEFRKYLIEAHEKDIGFHIEVQGSQLDTVEECLLPLSKGDIIMSPVPAGSKSGGAKILSAIAIASLFFVPGIGTYLQAGLVSGAGATNTIVSLGLSSLAVNLAITGIQQLMAPDPSVDEQDESYLFNGNQRTVVEGDPVPILYGELAVPGYPISFEVSNELYPRTTEFTDSDGGVYYSSQWAEEGNYVENTSEETNVASDLTPTGTILSRSQNVVFTDIISEGPIYGFVRGGNSVRLNNVPLMDSVTSSINLSQTSVRFAILGTAVAIAKGSYTESITTPNIGKKNLILRDAAIHINSTVTEWTDSSDATGGIHGVEITSTSFFNTLWQKTLDDPASDHIVRLVKDGYVYFEGFMVEVPDVNTARCVPILPGPINLEGISTFDAVFDAVFQIESIADDETTLEVAANPYGIEGTFNGDITGSVSSTIDINYATFTNKESNTTAQLRVGTKNQPILDDPTGTGIGAISGVYSSGVQLQGRGFHSDTQTLDSTLEVAGRAEILGSQPSLTPEVDEVRININYPALFARSGTSGKLVEGSAWWAFYVRIKRNATDSWSDYVPVIGPKDIGSPPGPYGLVRHKAATESPISAQDNIDLTRFKPFYDFQIKIDRLSDDDVAYGSGPFPGTGTSGIRSSYTAASQATVSTITYIVKEPLNYPYTAVARVTTNSKKYASVPTRSYHCRGKKVLVPSNYITREESTTGVASYNRNVTTGAVEPGYQDWNGEFRATKVYTNNPAWVFYDLLTNKRYGLGRWLQESDIDTYALYRVAQFCDELVTDGNGGLEPRFTSNIYLTKATDAYKVLKDMATTFNGLIYWLDGKIVPIPDQAGDPVYNFSTSNVIEGSFVYETTGDRTRANQVIVTWNNPEAEYVQEALIVEDVENIISTGKIIPQEAVAFGATSEGQALRYGRWKLWTAKNQTELVSFKTSLNAGFLMPGDIINIQDPFRYPAAAQYSGRVSSSGTLDATTIPLDRAINLQVLSDYELSVLIEAPGAYLAQVDSVVINGITYTNGDLIPEDRDGNPITTKQQASNLLADGSPGAHVITHWSPHTRVETLPVSTTSGPGITTLEVGSPGFSEAPSAQASWVLTEKLDGDTVEGSTKAYKVLSIGEDSKNEFSITAVEHYNQKFTSIDEDFVLSIDDPVFPYPKPSNDIPRPRNVYVVVNNTDADEIEDDATLYWDYPENADGTKYEHVDKFALIHNVPGLENPIIVDKTRTSISGVDMPQGTYSVGVSTISTNGNYSWPTTTYFSINDYINQRVYRVKGYVIGGISSTPFVINSAGQARFLSSVHDFTAPGNPGEIFTFNGTHYTKDCSGIPQIDFSTLSGFDATLSSHYMYFDYDGAGFSPDTSPPAEYFKLIQYKIDEDLNIEYVFDTGDGSGTYLDNWVVGTGTISVAAGYNIVIGDGTSFTTELEIGDHIRFTTTGSPGEEVAGKVAFIVSDTDVRLDRSFSGATAPGTGFSRTLFRVDKNKDCVFAAIRNNVPLDPTSPPASPPLLQADNFTVYTDRLDINPSYRGIDSENSTFKEDVLGPTSLVSVNNRDFIFESFNYLNSDTDGATAVPSPASTVSVGVTTRESVKGLGKFIGQEATLDDGTNSITGPIVSFDGNSGSLVVDTTSSVGTSVDSGASISMQPNLFDVDIYGRIRSSYDGYAEFAKATQLASIGIDFQTTSDSDINFNSISIGGTVDFVLDKDFVESTCDTRVLAVYNFLQGSDRQQYYVSGTFSSWTPGSPKGTLTVTVDGFEGIGGTQGTWSISVLQEKLSLSREGDLVVTGDISAFCCSDKELKDNVVLIPNALEKISKISGYSFDWNSNARKTGHDVGVLAQELREVLPEVVVKRSDGYLAVDYERIVPLLIEGIKELQQRIEELEND